MWGKQKITEIGLWFINMKFGGQVVTVHVCTVNQLESWTVNIIHFEVEYRFLWMFYTVKKLGHTHTLQVIISCPKK